MGLHGWRWRRGRSPGAGGRFLFRTELRAHTAGPAMFGGGVGRWIPVSRIALSIPEHGRDYSPLRRGLCAELSDHGTGRASGRDRAALNVLIGVLQRAHSGPPCHSSGRDQDTASGRGIRSPCPGNPEGARIALITRDERARSQEMSRRPEWAGANSGSP